MKDFSPLSITAPAVGFPARIGVITRTDGTIIRFAESDEAVVISGDTFAVVPGLRVSAVKHTANGEMPSCQIMALHDVGATFDSDAIDTGLFDAATVQIYIVDRLNQSRKGLLFTGAISNISTDPIQHQVTFDVKGPASTAKILMTQKRAPMCRTDLFSVLCGVNKVTYAVTSSVVTVPTSFTVTVSGALAQATGYFNQGTLITATGVALTIGSWNQSTQTLTTYLPLNRLVPAGVGLTLYPGCDKTLGAAGCAKFSNQLNFQGEPHFLGTAAAAQQV